MFSLLTDIQEFYEVTLLDNQRCGESVKVPDVMPPMNLWDFSSIQSTTVTSDTLPSLSTSIEVRVLTSHKQCKNIDVFKENVMLLVFH
ncbi:hypothetical protein PO909_030415 [Leuciscus waleckii]